MLQPPQVQDQGGQGGQQGQQVMTTRTTEEEEEAEHEGVIDSFSHIILLCVLEP